MWGLTCILLLWFQPYLGLAQFDMASQIFKQVNENLKNSQANFGKLNFPSFYQPLGTDLGQQIFQNVHESLKGTQDLGTRISQNVQQQLAPLQDLGLRIHTQVHKSLEPARALSIKSSMINGVGGVTIATYYGSRPRSFVIKNGMRSICQGTIQGPQCYGYLEPFDIINREDFCYATSYASINSRICLSSGHLDVQAYDGQLLCRSADGSPTLKLSRWEYRNLCGNTMPWQVLYRYYANPNDPRAIPIPNPNSYVVCRNNEPGVCEFEADGGGSGTFISSSSGININSNSFQ